MAYKNHLCACWIERTIYYKFLWKSSFNYGRLDANKVPLNCDQRYFYLRRLFAGYLCFVTLWILLCLLEKMPGKHRTLHAVYHYSLDNICSSDFCWTI